jgi:hypothetical protein
MERVALSVFVHLAERKISCHYQSSPSTWSHYLYSPPPPLLKRHHLLHAITFSHAPSPVSIPAHHACPSCSYTTFNVTVSGPSTLPLSAITAQLDSGVSSHVATPLGSVTVTVTNTGAVASDYVILVFAVPPTPGEGGAPLKSLIAFDRIHLGPGATQSVSFPIVAHSLAFGDSRGRLSSMPGTWALEVQDAPLPAQRVTLQVV